MKPYGYIYKITNNVNGKIYIGQKKGRQVVESYYGSGKLILAAIEKYSINNFSREILEWCYSKEELNEREMYWISHYNSRDRLVGYNIAVGGNVIGMPHSKETIEKIRSSNIGKKRSAEACEKMRQSHKGKTLSEEHKKKISETQKVVMKGKNKGKHPSEDTIRKRVEKLKGHPVSEETRKKLSEANKGHMPWSKGKHLSDETKRKISEAKKGKYGRHFIMSEEQKKKLSVANAGKTNFKGHHHSDAAKKLMSIAKTNNVGKTLYNLVCRQCGRNFLDYYRSYKYCPQCKPRDYSGYYTVDLPIIGFENGTGKNENTLGNFVVDFKGNEVRVGSGLTDEERNRFWESREDLIGRIIEVKYKDISKDKNSGKESLQFPVFVRLREIGKEVSYD